MAGVIAIDGLDDTLRALRAYGATATDLRNAFKAVGNVIVPKARSSAPRRTEAFAKSIRAVASRTRVQIRAGGKRAHWARWAEFGNHYYAGRKAITTAAADNETVAARTLDNELRRIAQRYGLT